jgi:hypothetical protein
MYLNYTYHVSVATPESLKDSDTMTNMLTWVDYVVVQTAVQTGDIQQIKDLVEQGFDLNYIPGFPVSGHSTPLICFAMNPLVLKTMVELGAEINALDNEGLNVLHRIMRKQQDNTAMIRTIVRMGVDVSHLNRAGFTAMECLVSFIDLILHSGNRNAATRCAIMQLNVDAHTDELRIIAEELRKISQDETFAMGQHHRLGASSLVLQLEPEVCRMVLSFV